MTQQATEPHFGDHIPKQRAYDAGAEALLIAIAAQAASETINLYSSLLEVEITITQC